MHKSQKSFRFVYFYFLLGVLCLQILFWMSPTHEEKIRIAYLWPAALSAFLFLLCAENKQALKRAAVGPFIALWLLLTCIFNGDPYLVYNQKFMMGIFLGFGVCYPTFLLADQKQRAFGLKLLGYSMVILFACIACLGAYVTVTNTTLVSPFFETAIAVEDHRLYVFTIHPNEIACIFTGAMFWGIYLMADTNRKWLKALLTFLCLCLYIGVALTVSWTSKLSVAAGLGLAAVLLIMKRMQAKPVLAQVGGSALAFLLTAAIAVAGFSGVISATSYAANAVWISRTADSASIEESNDKQQAIRPVKIIASAKQPAPTQVSTPSPTQAPVQAPAIPKERDVLQNLSTFTGRTDIWKSGIQAIQERPLTLLIGMTDAQASRVPLRALGRDIYHMHNAWMEMLLLGGIPGLLLYLWFCVSLSVSCVRLFLRKSEKLSIRLLAIAPAVMLVHCLMEIYPSFAGSTMDMMFLILAGAVAGYGAIAHDDKESIVQA